MPLYEYVCPDCGQEFEKRMSFSQDLRKTHLSKLRGDQYAKEDILIFLIRCLRRFCQRFELWVRVRRVHVSRVKIPA